jgi:hypothetical protein
MGKELVIKKSAEIGDWLKKARSMAVNSQPTYEAAAELAKLSKLLQKSIKEDFAESKATTHDAWKAVVAQEKGHLEPLIAAEKALKGKMGGYWREQEVRRVEKERKERAKQQAILEKQREAEAKALFVAGEAEAAEELKNTPVVAPEVKVESRAKAAGIVHRNDWTYVYTNIDEIDRKFMIPDPKAIRNIVKALHKDAEKIVGGITVVTESTVAVRT